MRKTFTFAGVRSDTFGIYISGSGVYAAPQPDLEYVSIPGRSGDLVYDNGRFQNIELTYPGSFILSDFRQMIKAIQAWLLSHKGYYRLEDDYQPDHFRMASVSSPINPDEISWAADAGSFDLVFNCMPQLWLKSGETVQTFAATGTITNPTNFTAKPLLRVYGYGTFTVGDRTITIEQNGLAYIDIDCELMNCTYLGQNANTFVTVGDYFPTLAPGSNQITISSDTITKIEVTPRWWTV